MNLPALALRRPVTLLVMYAALLVLGGIATERVPLEFLPNLAGPNFLIQIPYRNATPLEVEKTIAVPAEELLQTVPSLTKVDSFSQGNLCTLVLEFTWETDMDYAYLEVRDRLDRLKETLPRESQEYFVWRFSSTDIEVLFFSFSWDRSQEELYELVSDRIKPRLLRVDGVGNVTVWGQEPKRVYIDLDQESLKAHGVSLYDLVLRLDRESFNLAGGEVVEGGKRYLVRLVNEYRGIEDLEKIPLNDRGLRLSDVARVRYGYPEQTVITRMDGRNAVVVGVKKESTANTVEVCEAVKEEMERLSAEPGYEGLRHTVIFDQSEYILNSFRDLRDSGVWGGFFAVCVLYFFLRRVLPTLVVTVAIPVSLLMAVTVMYFAGLTLNVVSMVGLMLGVGMLVDNSIVVSENILRLREQGLPRDEASLRGSREVAMAILASTLTTMIVFLPMVFMESGVMKVYTQEVGVAISLSLAASLFVALTFIPAVACRMPMQSQRPSRFLVGLAFRYRKALRWVVRNRGRTSFWLLLLVAATVLLPMRHVAQKAESSGDVRRVIVDLRLRGAQEPSRIESALAEVERILESRREDLDIEHIYSQSGYMADRNRIHVFLREGDKARLPTDEAKRRILDVLPQIPDVDFVVPEQHGPQSDVENEIQMTLRGEDPDLLESLAEDLVGRLRKVEGVLRAESDVEPGHDELQLRVDRSLATKYGVSPMVAAQTVAFGLRGYALKKMKGPDREMAVYVQLQEKDRQSLAKLEQLQLMNERGGLVPLNVVSRFEEAPALRVIRRSDGKRIVRVRAQTSGEPLGILKARLDEALSDFSLPAGYRLEFGRNVLNLEKSRKSFLGAIGLAIALVYFLLGGLFESYIHPLTILTSVPLALTGSYWVMYLTGTAMDVAGYIGLILMVGIVVNNAIVIVDHINHVRQSTQDLEEAIVQAGEDRLRPVLMTAATTILGLLPLAFGGSNIGGVVMFAPLAKAVMGGLALATVLTLFVIPLFYTFMEDAGKVLRRLARVAVPGRGSQNRREETSWPESLEGKAR
jgi:HAE1 family hydrophobic/amphiphilic exporter-1